MTDTATIPAAVIERIALFPGLRLDGNTIHADGMPQAWGEKFQTRRAANGEPDNACVLCARKAGAGDRTAMVLVSIGGDILPIALASDDEVGAYISTSMTMGMFPVGRECRKEIPAGFVRLPSGRVV